MIGFCPNGNTCMFRHGEPRPTVGPQNPGIIVIPERADMMSACGQDKGKNSPLVLDDKPNYGHLPNQRNQYILSPVQLIQCQTSHSPRKI